MEHSNILAGILPVLLKDNPPKPTVKSSIYNIRADGNLIYDPRLEELQILAGNLIKEDNEADNFTFIPSPTNVTANNLEKLKTTIELFDGGTRLFRGRILNIEQNINNIYSYICEGELAFLNDSVVRPYNWNSGGVKAYLQFLIDNHNSQVSEDRQFFLRNVTVVDSNDYITRASSDYPTTLTEMKNKLIGLLGGHFFLERIDNVTYIDYLEDSPYLSNQTIRLGENILDLKHLAKGQDIATAVIPLGAQITDEEGNDLGRLTIESVNNGYDYLYDEEAVSEYGYIFKTTTHDDITTPERLKTAGLYDLAYAVKPLDSIELQIVDLKKMGVDTDNIRFLDYVKVESKPHGLEGTLLITKTSTDILNPANDSITVGSDYGTFTKSNANLEQKVTSIEGEYVSKSVISDVNKTITNLWSSLTQTESNILSQVAAQYITQNQHSIDISYLGTQLEQTNNTFNFTFTQLNQLITEVNNELQTQFNEQVKYIRFEDGSIYIGMLGADLLLKQSYDRISFLQSDVEVAYFSNRKLYVYDGEFINSLTVGNFGYIPRANGNVSWKKVK